MHQDSAFYRHANGRYVDCLLRLDETDDDNGGTRFLDGSRKEGVLDTTSSPRPTGRPARRTCPRTTGTSRTRCR